MEDQAPNALVADAGPVLDEAMQIAHAQDPTCHATACALPESNKSA